MNEWVLLSMLVLAHLVGDFYLQPYRWVASRNRDHHKSPQLTAHALVHGILTLTVLLLFTDEKVGATVILAATVFASHWLIDWIKSYQRPQSMRAFLADQVAHALVLIGVWIIATEQVPAFIKLVNSPSLSYKHIVVVVAYLIILKPTSVIITMLLEPWTKQLTEHAKPSPKQDVAREKLPDTEGSLASAGKGIGYLERILILTFILLNQFSAIGFLMAAKSVFRFGDLRQDQDKKLTEYVMLGTLISFTVTIMVGILTTAIVSQLPTGK
ncbi:DUF3307 domain-containing protein [Alteromonas pelagimontana]|uniref:DUF3307 domain-containing protein n=1 Tax=Alteromonas pelagimontana TaxID=1858656 RepID=A0A6M4MH30_9ALTE|nr:DUF3307 domain-containing protein [Alteromonas pelagimontana]QJR82383.1 DUF3307 domain-containing protein [Alteromonas pelagimontana]